MVELKGLYMALKKSKIFFGSDTVNLDTWKVKKAEDAARELLRDRPGFSAFIYSDDVLGDHFVVKLGRKPGEAAFVYEGTIVDEDTMPYMKCKSKT